MKKNLILAAVAVVTMTLSSCGMLGGGANNGLANTNNTANTANTLLGTALTGQNGSSSNLLGAVLGQLMQGTTTQASLVGTWTYNAPKVVFESDNVLAQLGSTLASTKIESTLNTYMSKIGMKAGATQLTFKEDGTCLLFIKSTPVQGTYTYDAQTHQITVTSIFGVGSLTGYATVIGNELDLVFEADKLLALASKTSTMGTTGASLSAILGNYKGLKIGMALVK